MVQSRWSRLFILPLCPLSFASAARDGGAQAQHPLLSNTHTIRLGAAIQKLDGDVTATRSTLPPVSLDLDELGIDDTDTSWMIGYHWRFADRWKLVAGAFAFDTDGSRTAQRDFNFDGKEFSAGTSLDTSLQANVYIVDVMYSVYQKKNVEIALGGGIHAFDLDTEIKGQAIVGGANATASSATADLLLPLPNLRANAFYAINDKLGLGLTVGWLSANFDDYDGQLIYLNAEASYFLNKRWGLNVGYQFTDVELSYKRSSTEERDWDLEFQGPTISLMYSF